MVFFGNYIIITLLILSFDKINNFVALPFSTIFIKDKTINETNYFANLTQTEIYVNLTIGSNKEMIKSVLKMEKNGFIIYEKAYDFKNSSTYETFDKDINIRWIPSSSRFPSKDELDLFYYESYKDFIENKADKNNITNKTEFLRVEEIHEKSPNYFNDMFYEYGIIGLQLIANSYYTGLEFVKSLKKANITSSYTFHLYFENITKNGFATNNNKGYFLIGEELTDIKNNENVINYTDCLKVNTYSKLIWGLNFSQIFFKYSDNSIKEIENIVKSFEIIVNFPYIKAMPEYFKYINSIFFDELLEKNICHIVNFTKHDIYTRIKSFGYACDSKSKYFMESLNTKFPDLILYYHDIHDFNKNFSLTKNDLFAFNNDDSDTNLYFLIVNGTDDQNNWIMGIPFLKKYVLSFDYDKKRIGYYINYGKDNYYPKNTDNNNVPEEEISFFSSDIFKILLIVISAAIIFILGMLFNNYLKKTRKKRANELDDDYEYGPQKDQIKDEQQNMNKNECLGINEEA